MFPGRFVYVGYNARALSDTMRETAVNILKNGPLWDMFSYETNLADRWEYKQPEEKFLLHNIIKGEDDADIGLNIISFPTWTFKMSDLMKHIGEEEIE